MPVPVDRFGKDHWSLFAYVECRTVDDQGVLNRVHLRCDPARHPGHAHEGSRMGSPSPTKLAGNVDLPDHDDWDCLDDLEAASLISSHGTGINPWFKLTRRGRRVAALLREHKAKGGNFAEFRFKPPRTRTRACSSAPVSPGSSTASGACSGAVAPSPSGLRVEPASRATVGASFTNSPTHDN